MPKDHRSVFDLGEVEGREAKMQVRRALIATAASLAFANMASAAIITLSDFSSNGELPPIPAEDLSATLDFQVSGNTLTLTVTNDTPSPIDSYNINQIFFNFSDNVSNLAISAFPAQWLLDTTGIMVDGWGVFDVGLIHGHGDNPGDPTHHLIEPGALNAKTFEFTFDGVGITENDFVLAISDVSNSPGNTPMFAAAKFVQGPNDDSAFGAVPEPGTLALLGLAGGLLAMRRRRTA